MSRKPFVDVTHRVAYSAIVLSEVLKNKLRALCGQTYKIVHRVRGVRLNKDGRHIELDVFRETPLVDVRTRKPYIDNKIRMGRYTVWKFLPLQLLAQFSKAANFYYLCISILQMLPGTSTTGRYTTLVPLMIFVGISISREGYDDLRRSWLDAEENNSIAYVLRAQRANMPVEETGPAPAEVWAETKWRDIKVGDIIRVQRNQTIPADIALLSVDSVKHLAYIETMALDGETSLKTKQASPLLANNCFRSSPLQLSKTRFEVESPNSNLYKFEGKISVADEVMPLTDSEVVYRGSVLRNTQEVQAMVIYTGEECKIRMDATKNALIKAPELQTLVNKVIIMIVFLVGLLTAIDIIAYHIWHHEIQGHAFYLSHGEIGSFQLLTSFFLMFNSMIPLSLYISLDIVKQAQIRSMEDIDMYDEQSDTPVEARTSTINENLGQVR